MSMRIGKTRKQMVVRISYLVTRGMDVGKEQSTTVPVSDLEYYKTRVIPKRPWTNVTLGEPFEQEYIPVSF